MSKVDLKRDAILHSNISSEVLNAYNSSFKRVTKRVAFFESDNETPWRPDKTAMVSLDGSVSVDGSRDERRNISLKILNTDGTFSHDPQGFWYDKVIKAYRGIVYWSDFSKSWMHFEYKLGEFLIDRIDDEVKPSVISITGRDFTKKLLGDKFDEPVTFKAGSNMDKVIRDIATNGGIRKFNLQAGTITLKADAAFDAEVSRWEVIKKICEPHNIEVYFNNEGQLTTRRYKEVDVGALSDLYLNAGSNNPLFAGYPKNVVSAKKSSSDSNVFNAVRVTATSEQSNVTGARFWAVRENRNINTPTCIQKIGRRPTYYKSSLFANQQQVNEYADRLLAKSMLEDFNLSFESIMYPWLEANTILQFDEPDRTATEPMRYLLSDLSIPLALGPMSGTGKRITYVGNVDQYRTAATPR